MLDSVRLEIVLILTQDRCTVCAKCNIGSAIILDASDGTPSNEAEAEAQLRPFKDSANLDAR
jgi:hypothetical protein